MLQTYSTSCLRLQQCFVVSLSPSHTQDHMITLMILKKLYDAHAIPGKFTALAFQMNQVKYSFPFQANNNSIFSILLTAMS